MKFNKSAMMSKAFKVSNVRLETGEGEEGGDAGDLTPARSIRFTQIDLTAKQFEELYGREGAADFYFDYSGSAGGKDKVKPVESNDPITFLNQVYKDCAGQIQFGVSDTVVEFESAKIKNISVDRTKGKYGQLRFTLVAPLPMKISTLQLEAHFGKPVKLQISTGGIEEQDAKQPELGLEGGKTGEEVEDSGDDEAEGVSGAPGRKPRNSDRPAVN